MPKRFERLPTKSRRYSRLKVCATLIMVLGTAILAARVGDFFALLICFCVFWVKARQEELLLTKHLPGYSEYMARTKALVPFVL